MQEGITRRKTMCSGRVGITYPINGTRETSNHRSAIIDLIKNLHELSRCKMSYFLDKSDRQLFI
jgi:hypothetical protein